MGDSPKICMISLGCAKNLVDSEILIGGLKQEKYEIVQESDDADILIVNTCGFLDTAREESVDVILQAGKLRKQIRWTNSLSWDAFPIAMHRNCGMKFLR